MEEERKNAELEKRELKNFLKIGVDISSISQATGYTKEEIENIQHKGE